MGNCASAKVVVHAGDDDAQPVARSPSAGKLAKESGSEVTNRSPTPGGSVAGFVTSCNTEALADGQQSAKTAQAVARPASSAAAKRPSSRTEAPRPTSAVQPAASPPLAREGGATPPSRDEVLTLAEGAPEERWAVKRTSNSPDDAPAPQDDWVARVSALEKLEQEMKSCPEEDLGAQWASAVVVLDEMVRDKLTPVFLASLSALQTAVGRCCRIVGEDTARDDLRRITPALVARAGNISARVRGDTIAALCALGRGLGCDYVLQQLLDHKGKGKLSAAQLTGRLEAIAALVRQHSSDEQGPLADAVRDGALAIARDGLVHQDDKLRRAGGRLAVLLYRDARVANVAFGDVAGLTRDLNPALRRAVLKRMREVDAQLRLPTVVPADAAPAPRSALPEDRPRARPAAPAGGARLPPMPLRSLSNRAHDPAAPGAPAPLPRAPFSRRWASGIASNEVEAEQADWPTDERLARLGSTGRTAAGDSELEAADCDGGAVALPQVLDDTDEALMEAMLDAHSSRVAEAAC